MRPNRFISLSLTFAVTCCVWLGFFWTMAYAPAGPRARNTGEFEGARSSGGLASNFATAVVRFFDTQDPREQSSGAPPAAPLFDSEMVEYLPLPKLERKEMAEVLPEVFADLSLTPRNLFRSDVDLDGDNDLDLALLVRLSKTEALGAVLEYLGKGRFRFAGKFRCRYERPEDFSKCFTVVLTGAGRMHILSHTSDLGEEESSKEARDESSDGPRHPGSGRAGGWRWMRLEHGALVRYGEFEDPVCDDSRRGREGGPFASEVEPVPDTTEDMVRFITPCRGTPARAVYRYDDESKRVLAVCGESLTESCAP